MRRLRHVVPAMLSTLGKWAALIIVAIVCSACVSLPDSGPVEPVDADGANHERPVGYLPGSPRAGESASEIVTGFLNAMTASPPQTGVAEQFLTVAAKERWRPERVIVYGDADEPTGQGRVLVRLRDAYQLDARGAYDKELPAAARTLTLPMAFEGGEWRIASAPNALVVPQSWIDSNYTRANVYFFDPSGQILVPQPVMVPRGDQLASALAQSLARGPGPALDQIVRTYLPSDTDHDLVLSIDDGVADVPLGEASVTTERQAELTAAQLAWTLRQDPAIDGLRITTADGPLPGLMGVVDVTHGAEFDPTDISAPDTLFALREGRLASGSLTRLDAMGGPIGQRDDYQVESFAVSLDADQVAAVAGLDNAVLLTQTRDPAAEVQEVMTAEGSVVRPAWDFADRLWVIDHPESGARVRVFASGRLKTVTAPGITGTQVRALLVSRDGSRLVAVVRGEGEDRVLAARIRSGRRGGVRGISEALRIAWPNDDAPRIRDIAWRSSTRINVLSRVGEVVQSRQLNVDRQPVDLGADIATLSADYGWLTGSPVDGQETFVASRQGVSRLASTDRIPEPVPGDPRTLSYVG